MRLAVDSLLVRFGTRNVERVISKALCHMLYRMGSGLLICMLWLDWHRMCRVQPKAILICCLYRL